MISSNKTPKIPTNWPKGFAYTNNIWFDFWRMRPSEAGRAQGCLAWSWLPRDNDFRFARANAEFTASERASQSKAKTDHGTSEHLLFSQGKLKGQVERFGAFTAAHHEVPIFYDWQAGVTVTGVTELTNDQFRSSVASRAYLFGTADYVNTATREVSDLKTGKLKEEALNQLAMYAHMAGIDATPGYTLSIWHKRARTDRMYKPDDFGQSNESLKKSTKATLDRVRTLLLSGDKPEPEPGPHCSYCPSRFFCDAYLDGYIDSSSMKPLKPWLLEELAAYRNKGF